MDTHSNMGNTALQRMMEDDKLEAAKISLNTHKNPIRKKLMTYNKKLKLDNNLVAIASDLQKRKEELLEEK